MLNEKFPENEKSGKQCRERWHNHLNPSLKKDGFTLEDEIKVFEYQKKLGNKWSEIANFFEGRNDNFIKNCFYSAIRRNLRKYNKKRMPSKQLKGTVTSLLKNPHTRKILMTFPEHENPEIVSESSSSKKKKIQKKNDQIQLENKKNNKAKIKSGQRPESRTGPRSSSQKTINTGNSKLFINFDDFESAIDPRLIDLTPRLSYGISGSCAYEAKDPPDFKQEVSRTFKRTDSNISDCSTSYYRIPEFTLQTDFEHYSSPKNVSTLSFSKESLI